MENRKYVVSRDAVYVGEVINTYKIARYNGECNFFNTKPGQLTQDGYYRSCRSMLFTPGENNFSNDLLYNSPAYPVLNLTSDEICLNLGQNSIVVAEACNLGALLEYFGFKKGLTYEDIVKIRKTFFTGSFAKEHSRLFGWKKITAEDVTFYSNGEIVTDPKELEKRKAEYREEQKAGHISYEYVGGNVLPKEYFDIIDARGEKYTFLDFWEGKRKIFTPLPEEGKIRRLIR